ncbi:MAG: recombinase family protein [Eubacteriales bacterium]|nr:recombinase family protein [Eubacteriales bacterium]
MKSVVAYIRVSTDQQCREDKFGLDDQKKIIIDYCSENDMKIVRWIADEGESGAKDNRPGFDRILYGDITNPPYEAVVVAKTDRVSRDIEMYFHYSYLLRVKKVELISVTEDFGENKFFANILRSFVIASAEAEREAITRRTSGGRAIKSAKGGYSGGRAPMGYKALGGQLVIDKREASLVRRIFELKDQQNLTLRAIAAQVNKEGYTARNGGVISYGGVRNILDNRKTYEGWYRYGKNSEWVKGQHEPILPPTTPQSTDSEK